MVRVGVHVSIAKAIDKAVDRAIEKGCDTFQIFSRNPRGWKHKELTAIEAKRFTEKVEHLKLIHLNDAKAGLNSQLDRHEHIGLGYIGEDAFRVILKEEHFKELPMILETPVDSRRGDMENIQKVRELADQY